MVADSLSYLYQSEFQQETDGTLSGDTLIKGLTARTQTGLGVTLKDRGHPGGSCVEKPLLDPPGLKGTGTRGYWNPEQLQLVEEHTTAHPQWPFRKEPGRSISLLPAGYHVGWGTYISSTLTSPHSDPVRRILLLQSTMRDLRQPSSA